MSRFNYDKNKAIAVFLYTAKKLGNGNADMHSVFKAMYFADRDHLVNYGRPVTGNTYCALKDGPVPSELYDYCKRSREKKITYKGYFIVQNKKDVEVLREPDMDELSPSDVAALDVAIAKVREMDFSERSSASHDSAWESGRKRTGRREIDVVDMADAGGADEQVIDYIKEGLEFANNLC